MDPDWERPFRTVALETVHDWGYSRLCRRDLAAPGGETFSRTYVDSPGAVAVVAVDDDDRVVLVEQYRAPVDRAVREIPAGMRDMPGEPPLETARRELAEEAGLEAREWKPLGTMLSAAGVTNSTVEIFLATGLRHVGQVPHGPEEEAMTVHLVPFLEAVEAASTGLLTDSKTVVGLLRAARLLGR